MKTWYRAKCDKCMEVCTVIVSNPSCTSHYLSEHDVEIQKFLERHYGCELTLIWRDDHLDQLWEEGYTSEDIKFKNS